MRRILKNDETRAQSFQEKPLLTKKKFRQGKEFLGQVLRRIAIKTCANIANKYYQVPKKRTNCLG